VIGKRTMMVDRQVARRARSRSKTKKIRRLTATIVLLILALVGVSVGWIVSAAKLEQRTTDFLALDAELRNTQKELEETGARLEQQEREIADLVANRLPDLTPLEVNKLVELNDRYLLSITFAESGVGKDKGIEYHAMLQNETSKPILPRVKLYLFDRLGIQVGATSLRNEDSTRTVDLTDLMPGETRSYHADIDIERDSKPDYFIVHVK
jgi:hypothetical protein